MSQRDDHCYAFETPTMEHAANRLRAAAATVEEIAHRLGETTSFLPAEIAGIVDEAVSGAQRRARSVGKDVRFVAGDIVDTALRVALNEQMKPGDARGTHVGSVWVDGKGVIHIPVGDEETPSEQDRFVEGIMEILQDPHVEDL